MIGKLSDKIAQILERQSIISADDRELYTYGFFVLLSQALYFAMALVFGILFKTIAESVVFYIAFLFIRKYAGGYHASTEARCEIMSCASILVCIAAIKLSKIYNFDTAILYITLIAAVCIFFLCPLDTPEKPLSEAEFKHFRKISLVVLLVVTAAVIVSYFLNLSFLFAPCCMSLILECILLIFGKLKKNSISINQEQIS